MPATQSALTDDFTPATPAELSRFVEENATGPRQILFPAGGRTSLHYGYPAQAEGRIVSTAQLTQVIDYPARDMTITVEAGIRVEQLTEVLKAERQQLPIDIAQAHRATLGGAVVTNTSGPRRFGYGTLRDYVIGIAAVDAQGRLFRAGGRVVKNVAGYDLCKLLVGSLGTLAIITELTLRLKPIPETTAAIWVSFDSYAEIESTLASLPAVAANPVMLEVLNPRAAEQISTESKLILPCEQPVLVIGVEGSSESVRRQRDAVHKHLGQFKPRKIDDVESANAGLLAGSMTEYQTVSDDPATFQANLLPSKVISFVECACQMGVAVLAHAGNGVVVGHLPDDTVTVGKAAEMLTPLRAAARKNGGNLIVLNCQREWKSELPVFGEPEPAWSLMRQLKQTFDPHDLLNPGRFLPN